MMLSLSNCTKDATSALGDLKGAAGQYGEISALVRNITDSSNNVQMATMNTSNVINALNQLKMSLRYIADWKEGTNLFQQLNTVINTIASPPGGISIELVGQYPSVDTVRAQIEVMTAFLSGFQKYFSVLPPDQIQEYNTRLTKAAQMLGNVNAFKSNPGLSASEIGQTVSSFRS